MISNWIRKPAIKNLILCHNLLRASIITCKLAFFMFVNLSKKR